MSESAKRLSLLFVNQFYTPDVAATGQHLADLAESLSERGVETTVLAGQHSYSGGLLGAASEELRGGVLVRRLRTTSFGRKHHLGRLLDYASYYLRVLWSVVFGRAYDGVVYLTTPPLIAVAGVVAKKLRGQRYALWCMDLHPDAEIAASLLQPASPVANALELLARATYRNADFIVELGPMMRERLRAKGVPVERMVSVPPWSADIVAAAPEGPRESYVRELGLEGKFVVMYSGNAGVVHDFSAICEAMRLLRDDPTIFFLFVGGGPKRSEIEDLAKQNGLRHFAYRAYVARERLGDLMSLASAHLVSLRPEFSGISVPSKIAGIMASARPALYVGPRESEIDQMVRAHDAGASIDVSDPGAAATIASTLRRWRDQPEEVRRLGENGRHAFEERFAKGVSCERLQEAIRAAWGK